MPRKFLKFFLAWIFLHLLMNLKWPSQERLWPDGLRLSPEILVLMILLCLIGLIRKPISAWIFAGLTTAVLLLRLFQLGEAVTTTYLNRQFNLYADPFLLPDLLNLLQRSLLAAHAFGYAAFAVISAAVVWIGIDRAIRGSFAFLSTSGGRRIFAGGLGILLALNLWLYASAGTTTFGPMVVDRVAAELDTLFDISEERRNIDRAVAEADRICPRTLSALEKRDVYLIFVESYGHAAFAKPEIFARLRKPLQRFAATLENAGFAAASGFLSAPTYGGASWLSHATVAAGVHVNNQLRYDLLLESEARPIADYFNQAGYRTVHVMPGTIWPWPEESFFGFQEKYYYRHLDYQGPAFGWSPMPDQFVFDTISRKVIAASRRPLFIEFVLTSVHAPFHRQPPYLPDWSVIADGRIYAQKKVRRYPVTWPDLSNAAVAYTDALKYEFEVLEGFLMQKASGEALVLIIGDHQPARQITGPNQPWSVPLHALSRRQQLLQPFLSRGFTPGIVPAQPPPHEGMEVLRGILLHGYCSP